MFARFSLILTLVLSVIACENKTSTEVVSRAERIVSSPVVAIPPPVEKSSAQVCEDVKREAAGFYRQGSYKDAVVKDTELQFAHTACFPDLEMEREKLRKSFLTSAFNHPPQFDELFLPLYLQDKRMLSIHANDADQESIALVEQYRRMHASDPSSVNVFYASLLKVVLAPEARASAMEHVYVEAIVNDLERPTAEASQINLQILAATHEILHTSLSDVVVLVNKRFLESKRVLPVTYFRSLTLLPEDRNELLADMITDAERPEDFVTAGYAATEIYNTAIDTYLGLDRFEDAIALAHKHSDVVNLPAFETRIAKMFHERHCDDPVDDGKGNRVRAYDLKHECFDNMADE